MLCLKLECALSNFQQSLACVEAMPNFYQVLFNLSSNSFTHVEAMLKVLSMHVAFDFLKNHTQIYECIIFFWSIKHAQTYYESRLKLTTHM